MIRHYYSRPWCSTNQSSRHLVYVVLLLWGERQRTQNSHATLTPRRAPDTHKSVLLRKYNQDGRNNTFYGVWDNCGTHWWMRGVYSAPSAQRLALRQHLYSDHCKIMLHNKLKHRFKSKPYYTYLYATAGPSIWIISESFGGFHS